jgi:hypothetical protein
MSRIVRWRSWPLGDGPGAPGVVELQQPARVPSIEADFSVPALQGILTGVVVGTAAAAVISLLWHTSLWPVWPAAVAIVAGGGWLWRMAATSDTLFRTESLTVDQAPAAPPAQAQPGLLMLNTPAARRDVADQVGQAERAQEVAGLVDFVRRCACVGCGESALGIKPSGRPKYLEAREILLELGAARWRDPDNKRLGWELAITPAAAVVLVKRHVAAKTATTHPTLDTQYRFLSDGRQ